jgi:hypothetical protein
MKNKILNYLVCCIILAVSACNQNAKKTESNATDSIPNVEQNLKEEAQYSIELALKIPDQVEQLRLSNLDLKEIPQEITKIKNSMDLVVSGAIETKGTTFSGGYRDANGFKGEGVKHLVVFYQAHCQMCLEKQRLSKVIKEILGGRGTYHCPVCQK